MTYYLLPKGNIQLSNCFQLKYSDTLPPPILSPSLTHYLYEILNTPKVNTSFFHKLQNDVHTYKKMVTNLHFSPDFFEIFEIIQTMHLNIYLETNFKTPLQLLSFDKPPNPNIKNISAFHYTKTNIQKDVYYNYYNIYNLNTFEKTYLNCAAQNHIIVATQPTYHNIKYTLIQMCTALCTQTKKGIFIWKMGEDNYTQVFLEIVYFLSTFYERIYVIKPSVMDISKSHRYIVCKGFLHENTYSCYTYLHYFVTCISNSNPKSYISSFLHNPIPSLFLSKLEEVNYILGQAQLEQLHYLLLLCNKYKDDKIHHIVSSNEQKCIEWCSKYRFFYREMMYLIK